MDFLCEDGGAWLRIPDIDVQSVYVAHSNSLKMYIFNKQI